MPKYYLDKNNQFIIEDYQNARPFSSFLPGIAGPLGIPLWVFYVNRGQAIASFGVENKDKPILEFQPANRAYQLTSYLGFRTFIKIRREVEQIFHEPFSRGLSTQKIVIGANELQLQEIAPVTGLQTDVVFFLLPGENLSGLVRIVTVKNRSDKRIELEMLDGLPAIIPYGINNQILKDIGRTAEAWMQVYNLEENIPFYKLRASVADTTEVSSFEAGHYMLSFLEGQDGSRQLATIIDPTFVFGLDTSLSIPEAFLQTNYIDLVGGKQIPCGRTPCGFAAIKTNLGPGESVRINSLFGHVSQLSLLQSQVSRLTSINFIDQKRREANSLINNLTNFIEIRTGSALFDAYCRQTYLDNILRGGGPVIFGSGKEKQIFYIYSRKHGDLERDYNAFSLLPEIYSQGNGSYRDINQNRRDDVWFHPEIGDFDIRIFMSLIQLDGYNPLVLKGSQFSIPAEKVGELHALTNDPSKLQRFLGNPFTPGGLLKHITDESIQLKTDIQSFLEKTLGMSEQKIEADFGEGYWVDHWTYNLDLIESYLSIFPDHKHELLFSNDDLPYYDSCVRVQPRSKKYILDNGQAHQTGCITEDQLKKERLTARSEKDNWVRSGHGSGEIYRCSLFAKLFGLAIIKFASLDSWGMGLEMEAGRPGWYDALNGLPGMFGSSMAETYALRRLIRFLLEAGKQGMADEIRIPIEISRLLQKISKAIKLFRPSSNEQDIKYQYWNAVCSARETFRESIRFGLDGREETLTLSKVDKILETFEIEVKNGIALALSINNNIPPTFFYFHVDEYELLRDKQGNPRTDSMNRPYIQIKQFSPKALPLFLEGMVRAMHGLDAESAETLYKEVKSSALYDTKLQMYKVNAPLDALPLEVGRARAFTPGWLENESIWLHMEYKYLLEVLRAGLYDHFFEDFKKVLIPFQDPKVYGRSPLENSSFLVSSAHPDKSLHGGGFVARLSGATAEFISIWRLMMAGQEPFQIEDDKLVVVLKPILPAWLFDEENTITYKFMGITDVTYHNPERDDTFDSKISIRKIILNLDGNETVTISTDIIPEPYSRLVRDGKVKQIDVFFQ